MITFHFFFLKLFIHIKLVHDIQYLRLESWLTWKVFFSLWEIDFAMPSSVLITLKLVSPYSDHLCEQ